MSRKSNATQKDIVEQDLLQRGVGSIEVEKFRVLGLANAQNKTIEELSEALALVIKSRNKLKYIKWEIGEPEIEVGYIKS